MTPPTRTVLLAQLFISGMMATFMSGLFALWVLGPTQAFLTEWGQRILVDWPVAFVFSLGVGSLAFKLAYQVNRLLP